MYIAGIGARLKQGLHERNRAISCNEGHCCAECPRQAHQGLLCTRPDGAAAAVRADESSWAAVTKAWASGVGPGSFSVPTCAGSREKEDERHHFSQGWKRSQF